MPLEFQLVQAPFRFGVEEGVDPKQVPFGTLLTAENVEWRKSGQLSKRVGSRGRTRNISGGGTLDSASRLIVRGRELALTNGDTLYSLAGSSWVDRGSHPCVGLTWDTIQDGVFGVRSSDVARLSNGQIVQAWVDGDVSNETNGGNIVFQIVDEGTGAVITSPTLIDSTQTTQRVRVLASGTTYIILWIKQDLIGGTASLCSYVNGVETTLATDVVVFDGSAEQWARACFDACVIDGSNFVVAYAYDTGGIRLKRYSIATTPSLQVGDIVAGEFSTDIRSISIDGVNGETLYVTYCDFSGSEIVLCEADTPTLANSGTTVIYSPPMGTIEDPTVSVRRRDANSAVVAYSLYNDGNADEYHGALQFFIVDSVNGNAFGRRALFAKLLSRPFSLGERFYVLAAPYVSAASLDSDIVGCDTYLLDLESYPVVGKIDLLIGGFWSQGFATTPTEISDTELAFTSPFLASASSKLSSIRQGTRLVRATIGESLPKDMWRSVVIGQEAYLAAGVLTAYDGVDAAAYGWAHPIYIDETNSAASAMGGTLATGTYLYNTVPERRTAAGVLHRGPGAITVSIPVTGPTGSVSLVMVAGSQSTWSSGIGWEGHIAIYRNAGAASPPGSVVQRLTFEPTYAFVINQQASPLTLTDDAPDNGVGGGAFDISERPLMYNAGELDDFQPPALVTIALYRERIFGISGDRRTVWFTKNHASNPGVAPGFNPSLRFVFNDLLTALAVLDERLFIFSETGIYYVGGDGPAPNGDDSDYGTPNKLQTDVGCTNAKCIASGPDGIFFVSGSEDRPEIHMLDRGLNVQWIGKRVQDQLVAYPTITSAVLVSSKNQVRFTCINSDDESIVLVFDYSENQWSTFIYPDGAPIVDACIFEGEYTFVRSDGSVVQENQSRDRDAGSEWITSRLVTAWIHAAGPLAYHSVRNFRIDGVSDSEHKLDIYVGFDGKDTFEQGPSHWEPSVDGVTSPGPIEHANVSIGTRRKCRSIRFKIEDADSELPEEGASGPRWSSMGIEVGVFPGLGRIAARQKG